MRCPASSEIGSTKVDESRSLITELPFVTYFLRRSVREGDVVLDVGCGTSPYRGFIKGTYVGLDRSALEYREGIPRAVDLVADAQALPIREGSVDVVFSVATLYQVTDPARSLKEFKRVLAPGGRLLLFDYNRRTQRRLEREEGATRPRWTQWRLLRLVKQAGFESAHLRVPLDHPPGPLEKGLRLLHQELFRSWAIVEAVR